MKILSSIRSANAQIVLAFSILSGMLFVLSAVVLIFLLDIETTVLQLTSNTVPRLSHIGDLREKVGLMQITAQRHILTDDSNKKDQLEQLLNKTRADIKNLLHRKQQLILSEQGQILYDSVLVHHATYESMQDEAIVLSRSGRESQAKLFISRTIIAHYEAYQTELENFEKYITAEVQEQEAAVIKTIVAIEKYCLYLVTAGFLIAALMTGVIIRVVKKLRQQNRILQFEIAERQRAGAENQKLIGELQCALESIKQLKGLLPICCSCKKIRNDSGYWQRIETYIAEHSEAEFTHGICPDCAEKLYPDIYRKTKK